MLYQLLYKFLQKLATKHSVKTEFLSSYSVVSNAVVGPIISSYFIPQVSRPHLLLSCSLLLGKVFSMEQFVHSRSQAFQGFHFVCCLVSGILALSHYASRNMYSSASWVSLINVLAPSSLGPIGVNSNFLHVQGECGWHFRHDDHDGSTTVDATCLLCFRDPLNFMTAGFMFQMFIDVSTCYLELSWLAPSANTNVWLEVNLLQSPPHHSAVVFVHLT